MYLSLDELLLGIAEDIYLLGVLLDGADVGIRAQEDMLQLSLLGNERHGEETEETEDS